MNDTTKPRIGYIGLGNMGKPMAMRFVQEGYPLTTWARKPERASDLAAAGAALVASPGEVAAASDFVFTCVTDTSAVRELVFGDHGISGGGGPGKIMIDMSSIEPAATAEMSARLKQETGMGWIDAPVSGGPAACAAGTLTVMAGGTEEDFAIAEPVIRELAGRLTWMGPSGAGQATKLVNQTLVGGGLALVSEAVKFAQDAGVDAARLPEALSGGRADSAVLQEWAPRMVAEDYAPTGTVDIILKDLNVVADVAAKNCTPMPLTSAAGVSFRTAQRRGFGQMDVCAVKKILD